MSEIKDKIENIVKAYVHKPHRSRELLIADLTRQFEWERKATLDKVLKISVAYDQDMTHGEWVPAGLMAKFKELEGEE